MKRVLSWCAWIVGALVVGYVLRTYVVGTARVVGSSMEPTLYSADIVVVTKFDYWFSGPARGDVALCRLPEHSQTETYLKRVAAVPGDTYAIRDGLPTSTARLRRNRMPRARRPVRILKSSSQQTSILSWATTAWKATTAAPRTWACFPGRILSAAPASRYGPWNSFFAVSIDGREEMTVSDEIRREERPETRPESRRIARAQRSGGARQEKPKKSVGREIREWVIALAAAVLIALLIRTFLFTLIRVDGDSMYDTLLNGERLFVSVLDVRLGGVERGDVVICHYPNRTSPGLFGIETQTNFVKRVRGVPGDVVERKYNVTYINGEAIDPDAGVNPAYYPTAIRTITGRIRWARTSILSLATTFTTAMIPATGTTAACPATMSAPSPGYDRGQGALRILAAERYSCGGIACANGKNSLCAFWR